MAKYRVTTEDGSAYMVETEDESEANKALSGTGLSVSEPKTPIAPQLAAPRGTNVAGKPIRMTPEESAGFRKEMSNPTASIPPMSNMDIAGAAGGQALEVVASPLTGIPSAYREVRDWAKGGFNPPALNSPPDYAKSNPLGEAQGNALGAALTSHGTPPPNIRTAPSGGPPPRGKFAPVAAAAADFVPFLKLGEKTLKLGDAISNWRNPPTPSTRFQTSPTTSKLMGRYPGEQPVGQQAPGTILPRKPLGPPPAEEIPDTRFQTSPNTSKLVGRYPGAQPVGDQPVGRTIPRKGLTPVAEEAPTAETPEAWSPFKRNPRTAALTRFGGATNTGGNVGKNVPRGRYKGPVVNTVETGEVPSSQPSTSSTVEAPTIALNTPEKMQAASNLSQALGGKGNEPVVFPGRDTASEAAANKAVNSWNKYVAGTESEGSTFPKITMNQYKKMPADKQLEVIETAEGMKAVPRKKMALGGVVDSAPAQKSKVRKSKRGILYGPPKELRKLKAK